MTEHVTNADVDAPIATVTELSIAPAIAAAAAAENARQFDATQICFGMER